MRFAYLCDKEKHQRKGCRRTSCENECNHTFLSAFAANPEAVDIARKFATYFEVLEVSGGDVYFEEKERLEKMSEKCSEKLRKMLNTEWTVLLLGDGRLGVVMEDKAGGLSIFGCNKDRNVLNLNGLISVKDYDKNLYIKPDSPFSNDDTDRDYDIMAMIQLNYINSSELKKILFGVKDPSDIAWDWKREETKEVTMADLEEMFGCKVKIVKEKENE